MQLKEEQYEDENIYNLLKMHVMLSKTAVKAGVQNNINAYCSFNLTVKQVRFGSSLTVKQVRFGMIY